MRMQQHWIIRRMTREYNLFIRSKIKISFVTLITVSLLWFFGAHLHAFEEDYYTGFQNYPLDINIRKTVENLKAGYTIGIAPINVYNYTHWLNSSHKCSYSDGHYTRGSEDIKLLYVVKSAMKNLKQRNAIRQTWGFESRFSDVQIRIVFVLGIDSNSVLRKWDSFQMEIENEQKVHNDIFQAEFIDSYYNNTIKTMMSFQWVVRYCPKAKYIMFVDDDYYVSTKNVLRYLRNPGDYPGYLTRYLLSAAEDGLEPSVRRHLLQAPQDPDDEMDQKEYDNANSRQESLYVGYRIFSGPLRHKSSKWYITLEEYPYHKYPPYITAGAYLMTFDVLQDLYYASLYTKHFRFDDIYLGILAKRVDIEPVHNPHFHFSKLWYSPSTYKYVIASHGYDNPKELLNVWNEQKQLGNA